MYGKAPLTRGHNYVVSRSFTFPLRRAGPPFGFGIGVVRKMVYGFISALAFVAPPVSLPYPWARAPLGSTRL